MYNKCVVLSASHSFSLLIKWVYNLAACKALVPHMVLVSQISISLCIYMLYVPWYLPWCHLVCDIKEHFVFPGNMAHFHVIVFMKSWFFECLLNFLAVNHKQFLMQITHKTKHQMNGNRRWRRFPSKFLWSDNADLKFRASNGETDDNKKPAEQLERASQCHHQEIKETLQWPKTCTEASTK